MNETYNQHSDKHLYFKKVVIQNYFQFQQPYATGFNPNMNLQSMYGQINQNSSLLQQLTGNEKGFLF
jgi:hypothetical protein